MGKLCKSCGNTCRFDDRPQFIRCPKCEEAGCELCDDGWVQIDSCPYAFVGKEMLTARTAAVYANEGTWPVDGGLLNQSSWFVEFCQRLTSDRNAIELDDLKNGK